MFDWIVLGAFLGYLALMLGIGFIFSRKQESLGDYYLGGRKMNKWVVALSAQASDMSGWLLMGLPGAVFLGGFSEAWIGIGLLLGTYFNWKIVAHRLRRYSQVCGDSITIPDFICNRFRDKTGIARTVAAGIILIFFTFYTASGFVAAAKLFSAMFGLDYVVALWIGAVVVVSYTLLGGYMAVCWTDFIQGSLMFIAIVLVPAMVIIDAGGFSSTVEQLNEVTPYMQSLFTNASTGEACGFIGLLSCMAWGLGYFGMPHILVRFMSINNPAEVKGSRRIAMSWVTISLGAAVVIGLVFHLFLRQRGLALADVGGDPEKCFMVMINQIFNNGVWSRIFAGILLSAILAAIMSTADSQLLVSASSFANDLYRRVRKTASGGELVMVSRLAVAAVAIVAVLMVTGGQEETATYWTRTDMQSAGNVEVEGDVVSFVDKDGKKQNLSPVAEGLEDSAKAELAVTSPFSGFVRIGEPFVFRGVTNQTVLVRNLKSQMENIVRVPMARKIIVSDGDTIEKGCVITDGLIKVAKKKDDFVKVVMKMVSFAWGGFGAAFGPLMILALFWRRTNLAGAISGMVTGSATCFIWKFTIPWAVGKGILAPSPIYGMYELAPGFFLALLATVVVSLLTKEPSEEMLKEFDDVEKE